MRDVLVLLFIFSSFSPLLAVGVLTWAFWYSRGQQLPKPGGAYLVLLGLLYGVAGAALTRVLCALFGGENAALNWIICFGPAGFSVGEVCALLHWWRTKPPTDQSRASVQPDPSLGRP